MCNISIGVIAVLQRIKAQHFLGAPAELARAPVIHGGVHR